MISHKHKCIFIHIPKTGGSSINKFLLYDKKLDWKTPNYEILYGWCPEMKIHLQHATPDQLLESGLITRKKWREYFKFSIVRNPWDRAFSDYYWIMQDRKVNGSFEDFIMERGAFKDILKNDENRFYRGDHTNSQTSYFPKSEIEKFDFVGRFENFKKDVRQICNCLDIKKKFLIHEQYNQKEFKHYSQFYDAKLKNLVKDKYEEDIKNFNYRFEEKLGLNFLNLFK